MNDYGVPERNIEPPDPPEPRDIQCLVCEDVLSEEDMIEIVAYDKHICIWCAVDVGKARGMIFRGQKETPK